MLDVGVPCSGLKLLLALSAFSVFFVLIANLKWWANAFMLAFVLPLALFINGLRIALIGVVGDTMGSDAGHQFHDYSGYITLLLCFVIVFKLARILGWKD
jgi:exosortase/archaeosortase family protein